MKKPFVFTGAVVFLLVALLHLSRLILGWDIAVNNWGVPHWFSWIIVFLSSFLALQIFRASRS
ncbi:MAG: hypothetical protein COV31_00385 [Candidatus Yanofskybacteria bacterium CG10_big_fil_rev_8_21_14_0_10_46_23]|uniref:Uncharacterized protein n=1 Tax=Candidatus Yanofskybacteria bacterium CG10_big_fil_rev_8_21_14_0_10_46_23 TaxID=1975098 RepID=A0A2H0R4X2_9BACT|nr:MAG: hypothetical protein COV31_00385 [Candidatus Yanofskybacteria bacterium CG10_big_fil_rev_8_21_14_0_10_46_23]